MIRGFFNLLILSEIAFLSYGYRKSTIDEYLSASQKPNYSFPLDVFIGRYGDPNNFQRERINEGSTGMATQELLYEGTSPRQLCPSMMGPYSDGSYYCTGKEFGYCDRRSGTCFCETGYKGIDCSECQSSYYRMGYYCYSKNLCPNDCSYSGQCNYNNGTCSCSSHSSGADCSKKLCSAFSDLCSLCDIQRCLSCIPSYYLTNDTRVCSGCDDFDPRCSACTKEAGCNACVDPLLTSVRSSGYRNTDALLPFEESSRELSKSVSFGSKDTAIFDDAEVYHVVRNLTDVPLNEITVSCSQGLNDDASVQCIPKESSHIVCGNTGEFSFTYPNYQVDVRSNQLLLTVRRTGGGYGDVFIDYVLTHVTTSDSDVIGTLHYTSSQTLSFTQGIVEQSFFVKILNDFIPSAPRVFQIYLDTPKGGGYLGPQYRTTVTIFRNDYSLISQSDTRLINSNFNTNFNTVMDMTSAINKNSQSVTLIAGESFNLTVQAYVRKKSNTPGVYTETTPKFLGGDYFLAVIENVPTENIPLDGQRSICRVVTQSADAGNGTYAFSSGIQIQGSFQQRIFSSHDRGLKGSYYSDTFFTDLVLERIDPVVNFTWGQGRILPKGGLDYMSVRWRGAVLPILTGYYWFSVVANDMARLWVDGDLLLDHVTAQRTYRERPRRLYFLAGHLYEVEIQYIQVEGEAFCHFTWAASSGYTHDSTYNLVPQQIVPSASLFTLYELSDSPVAITVKSGQTDPHSTECYGQGLFTSLSSETSYFTCCPRDAYGNIRNDDNLTDLSSELLEGSMNLVGDKYVGGSGPDSVNIVRTYDASTYCFNYEYTPYRGGLFQLNVTYSSDYDATPVHVAGSPFLVRVSSDLVTDGSTSLVVGRDVSLPINEYEAGRYYNFTIIARDSTGILRLVGGDFFEAYLYQTHTQPQVTGIPYSHPRSLFPKGEIMYYSDNTYFELSDPASSPSDSMPVVELGVVTDLNNGNYTVSIRPTIAGFFNLEVNFLHGPEGKGDVRYAQDAYVQSQGAEYYGLSVGSSPFRVKVFNSIPEGMTSTVSGLASIVNSTSSTVFSVTVRDAYYNVVLKGVSNVTVTIDGVLPSNFSVFNFYNGTYYVQYTPILSGVSELIVYVNNMTAFGSPFYVTVLDTFVHLRYTRVAGTNLHHGTSGEISYFEILTYGSDGKRIQNNNGVFVFETLTVDYNESAGFNDSLPDLNKYTGTMIPCTPNNTAYIPHIEQIPHTICLDESDSGHYYGAYIPVRAGLIGLNIYFLSTAADSNITGQDPLTGNPYIAVIIANSPIPLNTVVTGDLSQSIAGVNSYVTVHLRDLHLNVIPRGGYLLQIVLMQVAGYVTNGIRSELVYTGFDRTLDNYHATVTDMGDGSYIAPYNVTSAGTYVLRVGILVRGLNGTFFSGTNFGGLKGNAFDKNVLLENTISWTGNVPQSGYSDFYTTQIISNIDFDLRYKKGRCKRDDKCNTHTPFNFEIASNSGTHVQSFREEYWSARWVGVITVEHLEEYTVSTVYSGIGDVRVYIGGMDTSFNSLHPGRLIINTTAQGLGSPLGTYNFTTSTSQEIVIEYVHYTEDAYLRLYWQSTSTNLAVIPSKAFRNYQNISFSNVSVTHSSLSALHSDAVGPAATQARVGIPQNFTVISRDKFRNLVLESSTYPTMLGVGPGGIIIRGSVRDIGNGTYDIQYVPRKSGTYRMYVSLGCCVLHQGIGVSAEIQSMYTSGIILTGNPFILTVQSGILVLGLSSSIGPGLAGGIAGEISSFSVFYRDLFSNPVFTDLSNEIGCVLKLIDRVTGFSVLFTYSANLSALDRIVVGYNVTRAGSYDLHVSLHPKKGIEENVEIVGSPFLISMGPGSAFPGNTICQDAEQHSSTVNQTNTFTIQLYDIYMNKISTAGDVLYVRLVAGHYSITSPEINLSPNVLPICLYGANGKYACTYTPGTTGLHLLKVFLLPRFSTPGGDGLMANYFNGYEDAFSSPGGVPVVTRIDSVVSFSWTGGSIIPLATKKKVEIEEGKEMGRGSVGDQSTDSGALYSPLKSNGQSVRWDGYLVSPGSDLFNFTAHTVDINVSIYLDDLLLFDSKSGVSVSVYLKRTAAYRLKVIGYTSIRTLGGPISLILKWCSSTSSRYTEISQSFLYSSSQEIAYSPFSVNVRV